MERRRGVLSFLRGGKKGEGGRAAAPAAASAAGGPAGARAYGRPPAAASNGELAWDPVAAMESWLPPATPAGVAPGAAPPTTSAEAGSSSGGARSSKLASAWSKLKQRLSRGSPRRRSSDGATDDGRGALLTVGVSPLDDARAMQQLQPSRPTMLHTTGSAPSLPLQAAYAPGRPSRIPKPPTASGASQQGPRSSTPNGSVYGYGYSGGMGAVPAGPAGRRSPWEGGGPAAAQQPPQDAGSTARRLAFSPGVPARPGAAPGSRPIAIAGHQRQPSWGERGGSAGEQYHPSHQQMASARGSAGLPPYHSGRHSPAPPGSSTAFGGSLAGSAPGLGSLPLAPSHLLGMPARSGLAGRWVREAAPPGGDHGSGEDGAADVDFLLRIPPLQAAARERTRELQIAEGDSELVLEWGTQLPSGACIRRAEALPKSGALAAVPRLDGRAGSAAAQLSASIDGTLSIKALQGPPLPALVQHKLRLSSSGARLKVTLKVQLLPEGAEGAAGPAGDGAADGGRRGASARQATYWRRVHSG